MEDLRAGIVGTGFIGPVHARAVRVARGRVGAVAASTPERSAAAARELHADRAHDDWESLVADPDVDVVHVCAPNHLHGPIAHAALEAGKHVVCEKPLATTADDAAALVRHAADSGLVATVPFVYRYYPTVREARARVSAGEPGPLHLLHGRYVQDWLVRPEDSNWRVDSGLGGASRAFADIGSHWCDLVEFVSGHRIVDLSARTHTAVAGRATEDEVVVMFTTDGGALGSVVVSQIAAGHKNSFRVELCGAQRTLAWDQERPEELWVGAREGWTAVPRAPETLSPAARPYARLPAGHPIGYQECFDAFVAETYAAIRGDAGAPADGLPDFADGERAARLTDAVLAAAASGGWVSV